MSNIAEQSTDDLEEFVSILNECEKKVSQLYLVRDTEHYKHKNEKIEKLKQISTEILSILPLEPPPLNAKVKARFWYLRGKTLEVLPDYNKDAEACLSKAVKLDPKLVDAWNSLGHCFWKKSDLESARNCYSTALSLQPNKVSLRELSRVLRLIPNQGDNQEHNNLSESVAKAKEAVALDLKDGESWYVLGNAYLSHFAANTYNMDDLNRALKAYQLAAQNPVVSDIPDLHFNRAMVHKYKAEHQSAYEEFKKARELDPSLVEAQQEIDELTSVVQKIVNQISNKGDMRPRKLKNFVSVIPDDSNRVLRSAGYRGSASSNPNQIVDTNITSLQPGLNKAKAIVARVIQVASPPTATPVYFVIVDRDMNLCSMCVYGIVANAIKENDVVCIPEPTLQHFKLKLDNNTQQPDATTSTNNSSANNTPSSTATTTTTTYEYDCIVVANPQAMLVNGRTIPSQSMTGPGIKIQLFY